MRNSISVTGYVTRDMLGLSTLSLSVPGQREIVSLTTGGVTWRRTTAQGKYQRGRALLQAQQDTVTDVLVLRLYATSATALENDLTLLRRAFSQFTYDVATVIDGVTRIVTCEPADMAIIGDDTRQKTLAYHVMREVQFSIPRDPQLVSGGI